MAFALLGKQGLGTGILLGYHALHLGIYLACGILAIGALELVLVVVVIAEIGQLVAHTHIGNHAVCLLGDAFQIVHGSGRDMAGEEFLGGTSAQGGTHLVQHLFLGGNLSFFRQIPCSTQGTSTGHYGNLHQRVGILQVPTYGGMTSLVQGNGALLLHGHHLGLLLQTTDDTVHGSKEVILAHCALSVTGCYEGCLVADIGNVGTGKTGCLAGEEIKVEVVGLLYGAQMHLEDGTALVHVGKVHMYLAVKTSCTQQGLVQNVGTVGGGQNDDTTVGAETVHLGEQLVQRVLALVVATRADVAATGTSHGIYLIDEDDARALLLSLAEEVADTAGTNANEHLHEIRTAHGEERHIGLAGHSLGKQGLTCSRRAYKQGALGYLATQFGVLGRILQEVHYLLHLLLCTLLTGNVLERHLGIVLLYKACTALAHIEDSHGTASTITVGRTATAHAAHDEYPEEYQQKHGAYVDEEAPPGGIHLVLVAHVTAEVAVGTLGLNELVQFVRTGILGYYGRFLPLEITGAGEDIAIVFGEQLQNGSTLILIGHEFLAVALADTILEFRITYLLSGGRFERLSIARNEQIAQNSQDNHIYPCETERGPLFLVVIISHNTVSN